MATDISWVKNQANIIVSSDPVTRQEIALAKLRIGLSRESAGDEFVSFAGFI